MTTKENVVLKRIMQSTGGATPLMYACQQCRENEVLDILIKQPYKVKDRDRTYKTPLHYCAENGSTNCAEAVLKIAPELVNAQDENGYCTLHLAVIAGNKPLIKLLILKGADINLYDNEGHSAVHWAIVSSEKEALEMIIRAGANPSTPDIHGGYPLHYAVQLCGSNCDYVINPEDTVKVVETLLNFGVDVSVKDKDGRQPILWAASADGNSKVSDQSYTVSLAVIKGKTCRMSSPTEMSCSNLLKRHNNQGSAEAIIHLISAGACVEAADKDGLTALHCAASRGHTNTLETLITLCGANVDVIDANGCSALFYAVTLGHADSTELLLQLGAEPNRQDRKGRTPAHCGAAKGQLETLKILQKHGGNLWLRNVKGDFPLHEAVASGRKDLVLWLLSQNPEAVNVANNDGRCLIHIASMYNNTEMVKVLLDAKSLVNPVMRTSKGILMTPLNVALSKGHRSCGKFLQLHGGVPFSKVSKTEGNAIYAIEITPSDEILNKSDVNIRTITPSPDRGSIHRTSTDGQTLHSADKKKISRRRKKRKTNLNVEKDSESDTDDNHSELGIRTSESRRSERSSQYSEKDEEKIIYLDSEKIEKNRKKGVKMVNEITDTKKRNSREKVEAEEEKLIAQKVEKKFGVKQLQKNKSFSETKNVSDLSPEDFPPMMQTIEQIDVVIKESENNFSKNPSEAVGDARPNSLDNKTKVMGHSETHERQVENGIANETQNQKDTEEDVVKGKKNETSEKESFIEIKQNGKSSKVDAVKRFNGGSKKDEKSTKFSGSRASPDESSTKKVEKHVKSSDSKNSSSGSLHKKYDTKSKPETDTSSDVNLDQTEKSKKVANSKTSKSLPSNNKDKKLPPASAPNVSKDEKPKDSAEKPQGDEIDVIVVEEKASGVLEQGNKAVETQSIPFSSVAVEESEQIKEKDHEGSNDAETEVPQNVVEAEDKPPQNLTEEKDELTKNDKEFTKSEVRVDEPHSTERETLPSQNQTLANTFTIHDETSNNNESSFASANKTEEMDPLKDGSPKSTPEKENVPEVSTEVSKDLNQTYEEDTKSKIEVHRSKILTEDPSKNLTVKEFEKENLITSSSTQEKLDNESSHAEEAAESKIDSDELLTETLALGNNNEAPSFPGEKFNDGKEDKDMNLHPQEVGGLGEILESPKHDPESNIKFEENKPKITQTPDVEISRNGEKNVSEDQTLKIDLTKEYSDVKNDENPDPNPDDAKEKENFTAENSTDEKESRDQHFKEGNEWMNSGKRHYRPPKVPRLCRRHRDLQSDINQISVTQLVQNTIRKYHMERGIFYQLLELKRMQIRAGRANEQVLVKRLADEYERSIASMGMKHFSGVYKFRDFEKFLYEQLKSLNKSHGLVLSEMKSFDDIDALSGILKKTRYKIFSEIPQPDRFCTCITQRCHHSACAYTSVPCSTYISTLRRHKSHKPRKECFLPRIEHSPTKSERKKFDGSPATLELIQGNEKRVIALPQNFPEKNKKYYVTFTIKSSPSLKDDEVFEDAKEFFKHRHAKSV